tara:strand:- start:9900 stop:10784 length:885 start_codon:yes stop_codon:yes gene_type:complete
MKQKILILGATGILGNAFFRYFSNQKNLIVFGTYRQKECLKLFDQDKLSNLKRIKDINDLNQLENLLEIFKPEIVINCISLPSSDYEDVFKMLEIFSFLPKTLQLLTKKYNFRLIHISSDGVFDGLKGFYKESDIPNAKDNYGKFKFLGEVYDANCITIRTSIIGPDIYSKRGLLSWLLNQKKSCECFTKSIFSGFPTIILADIINQHILKNKNLFGLYHISSNPISKYELLSIVALKYKLNLKTVPVEGPIIDRSLSSEKFRDTTGFSPLCWDEMIEIMLKDHLNIEKYGFLK